MLSSILTSGLLATLIPVVVAQATIENITIAALPTFSTCQQAVISWSGGKTPYRVYIYPDGFVNQTDWIVELPLTTRAQAIWNVNLAAGSGIVINVWDGINDAYSPPTWIQDSGDSSCLGYNGTLQSSSAAGINSTVPLSTPLTSSLGPAVVSTPSARPTSSTPVPSPPAPPSPSQPSPASPSPPPPATVTVSVPNGSSRSLIFSSSLSLIMVVFSMGTLALVA